jgi:hypothetical protein
MASNADDEQLSAGGAAIRTLVSMPPPRAASTAAAPSVILTTSRSRMVAASVAVIQVLLLQLFLAASSSFSTLASDRPLMLHSFFFVCIMTDMQVWKPPSFIFLMSPARQHSSIEVCGQCLHGSAAQDQDCCMWSGASQRCSSSSTHSHGLVALAIQDCIEVAALLGLAKGMQHRIQVGDRLLLKIAEPKLATIP